MRAVPSEVEAIYGVFVQREGERRRSSGRSAEEGRKGGHGAATEVEELGQKLLGEKRAAEFVALNEQD